MTIRDFKRRVRFLRQTRERIILFKKNKADANEQNKPNAIGYFNLRLNMEYLASHEAKKQHQIIMSKLKKATS